jgi:acetyl esterase/lipase
MPNSFTIESLLSARLFLSPQLVGNRIFFISDLSGRLSLYAMNKNGSVPEPMLPRDIALQNPALMESESFAVFPRLGKILVMIDRDGDEAYQPMFVPLDGGIPEPVFGDRFKGEQVLCSHADPARNYAAFQVDPRTDPNAQAYLANLETRELTDLGTSLYGNWFVGHNDDYSKIVLVDRYTEGDEVVYLWERETGNRRVLYGVPLEQQREGETIPLNAINHCYFAAGDKGLLFYTSLFDDKYGLGYLTLDAPQEPQPVQIAGTAHQGMGELNGLKQLHGDHYTLEYNVDGVSWVYEGAFDETARCFQIERTLVGEGLLSNGVKQHLDYEKESGHYALSFSTATSPSQLYTIEDDKVEPRTHERILGIPQKVLAPGEDASYVSHDGLSVSARLYLPSPELGFAGKRPVVFYIHGGPQGQERPDFTWFSMPLIQFFTLNGFAVFVPNVRGSTGYGLDYMKRVDRDWGGLDRLDHVAAFKQLRSNPQLDMERVGVMGRSYGGYMTLTLAGRHPELWKAACDMFGPYNLSTFMDRIPETWKTQFYLSLGHPEKDRELIVDRSPSTHLHQLACPLLVIQGHNDPRVVERESRDLVEQLRAQGKDIELLVFENEGHDVLKFENKVRCYNAIVSFFAQHLNP